MFGLIFPDDSLPDEKEFVEFAGAQESHSD
jgi:hypothetical protein